ncbi:MAG: VOC family protein [Sedimenticola sp.]
MSEITGLHHISLIVADTKRALGFYQGVMGLKLVDDRPDLGFPGAWLWIGQQQIHLLELPNPDPASGRPEHGGRDRHTAVSVTNLDAVIRRLDAKGLTYTMSRSGRRALFCRDPDGNAWELIEAPKDPINNLK